MFSGVDTDTERTIERQRTISAFLKIGPTSNK